MLQRAVALALTLTMAFVLSSAATARAQSTQAPLPWQRTDSQHFEIYYPRALAPRIDCVTQGAERAYDRIAGQLNLLWPSKVPLVVFTAPGATLEEIRTLAGSAPVAPWADRAGDPPSHRSRLNLALPESDAQLDAAMVYELTHVLVTALVWQNKVGSGGLPYWIAEGVAEYMVGSWRDEDVRQMRELVASGDVPALSQLSGSGGSAVLGRARADVPGVIAPPA